MGQVLAEAELKMQGEEMFCMAWLLLCSVEQDLECSVNHGDDFKASQLGGQCLLLVDALLLKEKAFIRAGYKPCMHWENVIWH